MQGIPDGAIDAIVTDPPYQYLKNMKLDRPFDEARFFEHAGRVLKADGFIVLFGRGTAFYRWNTTLAGLGFKFKEEIVWSKRRTGIPALKLARVHETVSIHTRGEGRINSSLVPYVEQKQYNMESLANDIKRIQSAIKNATGKGGELCDLLLFSKTGEVRYTKGTSKVFFKHSYAERSRACATYRAITGGMRERSVIEIAPDHYAGIHPTQKPTRLMERLLALVSSEGDLILDPFAGSGSTAVACINTGRDFIGMELDREYCDGARARVAAALAEKTAPKAARQKTINF